PHEVPAAMRARSGRSVASNSAHKLASRVFMTAPFQSKRHTRLLSPAMARTAGRACPEPEGPAKPRASLVRSQCIAAGGALQRKRNGDADHPFGPDAGAWPRPGGSGLVSKPEHYRPDDPHRPIRCHALE